MKLLKASFLLAAAAQCNAQSITDLGTLGGTSSYAYAVSADGSVVVGYSDNASGYDNAFRWSAGVMTNLGTLGGLEARAHAVSANGSVVVGYATNASGDDRAFLYREGTMLDVDAWLSSVNGNSRVYTAGWTLAGLPMEGAHHRPMMSFDRMGKESQAWATGDFGSSSRTRDVHVTTGEAGLNWNVGKTGLIGFAAGHGVQNQDLAYEGSSATKGDYAIAEFDYRPEGTQWIISLLGMIGSWESKINRGYITGAGTDFSHGIADIITRTARLRVDAPTVASFGGFSFAPYASYTVTQTVVSAYAETGGSFAASFEEQNHNATEARLGVTAAKELSEKTKLLLTVEGIHRFDGVGPALIGQEIAGGLAFNQPGSAPRPDCVRLGFDVDHKLSADTLLNISAHASTVGEAHDVSAAISIRRAF
jgi:probable HAF family extracellular repeat protein